MKNRYYDFDHLPVKLFDPLDKFNFHTLPKKAVDPFPKELLAASGGILRTGRRFGYYEKTILCAELCLGGTPRFFNGLPQNNAKYGLSGTTKIKNRVFPDTSVAMMPLLVALKICSHAGLSFMDFKWDKPILNKFCFKYKACYQ